MYKKYIVSSLFLSLALFSSPSIVEAQSPNESSSFERESSNTTSRKIKITPENGISRPIVIDDNVFVRDNSVSNSIPTINTPIEPLAFEDVAAKRDIDEENFTPSLSSPITRSPVAAVTSNTITSNDNGDTFNILPGDILHINVWKETEMSHEVLVLPDGTITFPLVGSLYVQGMTLAQMQEAIESKLVLTLPDAPVTVSVISPAGHSVNVIGQVVQPGAIIMRGKMSVMQVLSEVGGLTAYADKKDILVIRTDDQGNKTRIEIPYNSIMKGQDLEKDIRLIPGDVIVVPTAGLF